MPRMNQILCKEIADRKDFAGIFRLFIVRRSLEDWKGALILASALGTLLDGRVDVVVTYTVLH